MSIHIGETIKGLVKSKGISVTDFANKINYSRRNVYEIFDKKTIDTGLLIKISKILDQNLFFYYLTDKEISEHKTQRKTLNDELMQMLIELKAKMDEGKLYLDDAKLKSLLLPFIKQEGSKQKAKKTPAKTKRKTSR